jgi:hypothetical protein
MTRWPDEEPDVDERSPLDAWLAEEAHAAGLCRACGHSGHTAPDCPHTPIHAPHPH